MEEYLLRFAIFLTYFFIAVSDKSLANGLKGFGKKHSATLHHLEGDRAENNRAKELFQRFVVNNQAVSSSPSWNQLSHELLGPASRSANPRMSLQVPKVKSGSNLRGEPIIPGPRRMERSVTQPRKVTNVRASPCGYEASQICVTWRPISYRTPAVTVRGYRISYRAISHHSMQVYDAWYSRDTIQLRAYTVNNLQPCSEYHFRVQVLLQRSAPGPYSDVVKNKTPIVPPSAPRNVQHVLKGDEVQITWETPAVYCHLITNYKIFYKESSQVFFMFVETGNVLSYILKRLRVGVQYYIKVQAFNVDGGGAFSPTQSVKIYQLSPSAPVTNLHTTSVTETTVFLAWGAPQSSDGAIRPVSGYKVYRSGHVLLTVTDQHSYNVTSLQSDTMYIFIVKAFNSAGDGPSASIEVTTKGASAPRHVTATPLNSTAVTLSWQPPKDNPSHEITYFIYYGPVFSGVNSVPVGITRSTTFVVGNLRHDVVYVFEVSLGRSGRHSDPVNSRPKSDDHYQPVSRLKAVIVAVSNVLILSWEKPADVTDPKDIKNYKVKVSHREGAIAVSQAIDTAGKETSHTFHYLNFNTRYTFEVRTVFSKGSVLGEPVYVAATTGPFSAPVGPLRVRLVHMDKSATLSWSAPQTVDPKNVKFYKVYWNCPRCYYHWYRTTGSQQVASEKTSYTLNNLQGGRTYVFAVHAETAYGIGDNATTSLTLSYYFGQVRNLTANINRNTMTVKWNPPNDIDQNAIKYYGVTWCNKTTTHGYCRGWQSTNVTGGQTQCTLIVLPGYSYSVNVNAWTDYGPGSSSYIRKSLQPLDITVRSASVSKAGKYGLQVYLQWNGPYETSEHVEYEVGWHCMSGGSSYCYWHPGYGWRTTTVSAHFVTVNMTHYDMAYALQIVVVTSNGRGSPYPLSSYIPALNGIPGNFTCDITKENTRLMCHWSAPTDVNPDGFYYYVIQYKCDDCMSSYFKSKSIYDFNQTSVNITVSRGVWHTVMIRVYTRYGYGKWAQTRTATTSELGPVLNLMAMLDSSSRNIVHLSWQPPANSGAVQYYVVTTECIHCGLNKVTNVASHTHLDKNLPCGNIYIFTVRAVIYGKSGDERKVQLTIEPQAGAVTNLAVKFIPGKNATDWIKRREDGLQLTWDPPSNLDPDKIESYEIIVWIQHTEHRIVSSETDAKTTHWMIRREDSSYLVDGQNYIFQVRCKALCGYGRNSTVVHHFSGRRPCHYWEFTCSNGRCINNGFKCDGQDNCGDGSDERGCSSLTTAARPKTTQAPHCPPGWLHCYRNPSYNCIKVEWLCDGTTNCPNNWDEWRQNCRMSASPSMAAHTPSIKPQNSSFSRTSAITSTTKWSSLPEVSSTVASKPEEPSFVWSLATTSTTTWSYLPQVSTVAPSASASKPPPSFMVISSPTKGFLSLPKDKAFPYWSIAVAIVGVILVIIIVYLVRKHSRQRKYRRALANLPFNPQDYSESFDEEDQLPLMLGHLTDDDTLITA